ncbi:MAG: LicD family protein [Clostridiales bacterium]|nr:LicD family protein [Candidatus Equinaster intestinalis]
MKRFLTVDEIKSFENSILKFFRDYCEKNGLEYYLACGTLLGAARHQGFIPWDDDIDVFMPRKDYNFLIENFNSSESASLKLISKETNPDFYVPFAKIYDTSTVLIEKGQLVPIGVFIDIIPLDFYPQNFFKSIPYRALQFIYKMQGLSHAEKTKENSKYKNFIIGAYHLLYRLLFGSEKSVQKKIFKLSDKISAAPKSDYCTFLTHKFFSTIPKMPVKWFEAPEKLIFEGEYYTVPNAYKIFLAEAYGKNYMEIPPKEKQTGHHGFDCYFAEEKND